MLRKIKPFILVLFSFLNVNSFSLSSSKEEPNNHWVDIQKRVEKGVVRIQNSVDRFNWLQPYKGPEEYNVMGTGFFIDNQGYILTNYHVVSNAGSIAITIPFFGDKKFYTDIVGIYPDLDIAFLKLRSSDKDFMIKELGEIEYLRLGDSDEIHSSQEILVLGYPLGSKSLISSLGIISGRSRVFEQNAIQFTAPSNPGNSGGPLLDSKGNVVGIDFAETLPSYAQNTNFAIPINKAKRNLDLLRSGNVLKKLTLGVGSDIVSNEVVKYFGNPQPGGLLVTNINKISLANKMGLEVYDMIYKINGNKVDAFGNVWVNSLEVPIDVVDYLERLVLGETVTVVIYRYGEKKELNLIYDDKFFPEISKIYTEFQSKKIDYEIFGGLVVMPLTLNHVELLSNQNSALLDYYNIENCLEPALIITHIFPDSCANYSHVPLGSIIDEVNGVKIFTLDDFREVLLNSENASTFSILTKEGHFFVLSIQKILEQEDYLSNRYKYPKSNILNAFFQKIN